MVESKDEVVFIPKENEEQKKRRKRQEELAKTFLDVMRYDSDYEATRKHS